MAILPRRRADELRRPTLQRVLCAVDGSRGSADAIREALVLAPCASRLCFIAITGGAGTDAGGVASLGTHRARQTLEQAHALACARGVPAEIELLPAADVAQALIARAGTSALLVVGTHDDMRGDDTAGGSIAASLAGRVPGPLLVARASGADGTGPRILVPVADDASAAALVAVAGSIAAGCRGYVHLVHVQGRGYGSQTRHRLAELSTALIEQTGAEPVVEVVSGAFVAAQICQLARDSDAGLVVVGRRSDAARPAWGPVAERVVHEAPCSVLVAPTSGG